VQNEKKFITKCSTPEQVSFLVLINPWLVVSKPGPAAGRLLPEGPETPVALIGRLLSPLSVEEFFVDYWEQRPLLIRRHNPQFYDGVYSRSHLLADVGDGFHDLRIKRFDAVLGAKVDYPRPCTKPATVEKVWSGGWTVQAIQPQRVSPALRRVVAALEDAFQCPVGCNAYLTPPGTQGLAPHYDDIEAFVLQLEGTKQWVFHHSDTPLPREYSRDFRPEELPPPFLEVTVSPGDLLYFPRGTVHYARAVDQFSHHLTVSL